MAGSTVDEHLSISYSQVNGREYSVAPLTTKYAKSGDVNIAYQVVGNGPLDLVFVMGWVSHLDYFWQEPDFARFLMRLASFARLILFDKRGTGLSDRVAALPTLEQRMDDVRAVMDAVGSKQAALLGVSEGGAMCALFAATYPERTTALVMIGSYPRRLWATDYPWGERREERERYLEDLEREWGHDVRLQVRAPSRLHDEAFQRWWATYLRMSASPGAARTLTHMNMEIDIRPVLPTIRVPTLIIHRTGDQLVPVEHSRYMAARIPGARLVELPGADHLPFVGDQGAVLDEVEQFLTGGRPTALADRVLTTVLLAELVGTAQLAARLGERGWRERLAAFQALVRRESAEFRGRAVHISDTGILASFDGPARAIRCATALVEAARTLGLTLRAALHTGECEVVGDDLSGVAVQVAAAMLAQAAPGIVLVSGTVTDLVAGSGLRFVPHGRLSAAGLPGTWLLFRVGQEQPPGPTTAAPLPRTVAAPSLVSEAFTGLSALTPRELAILRQIAAGRSSQEIAADLGISVRTIERHITNLYGKLEVRNRAEATLFALRHGLA